MGLLSEGLCDLGGRPTIDSALHRLAQKGQVRRVIRGISDYPRFSEFLGQQLGPDIDQVARAFARKFRWRIQPSGAVALNLLGLSTQVPARAIYLSDGPDRTYKLGNTSLVFEHTALKEAGFKLRESGLIVQALKSLGSERITPEIISKIRAWLPESLRKKVLADTKTATGWSTQRFSKSPRRSRMDKIATWSASDRRDLFSESATRLGKSAAVVKKDFWVCWILKTLFADPQLKEQMVFKGGTSLSKVCGLVDRFSEDLDLVLDWRLLGYGTEDGSDLYQSISSKTKQDQYNRAMNAKAAVYIRESLLGELNQLFATVPGVVGSVDGSDPHTVNIKYPAAFAADYILSNVRLEIGPLASWVPSGSQFIHPYAAESFSPSI